MDGARGAGPAAVTGEVGGAGGGDEKVGGARGAGTGRAAAGRGTAAVEGRASLRPRAPTPRLDCGLEVTSSVSRCTEADVQRCG